MWKKALHIFGRVLILGIFLFAAYKLWSILKQHSFQDYWNALLSVSPWYIAAAVGLTVINYMVLVGYDLLAVRWVGQKLPLRKVAFASFTGYAFSYNFGATLFGTSIRYRLYSTWGVPLWKVVELLVILGLTFWFGLFALAGIVFIIDPLKLSETVPVEFQKYIPFADSYCSDTYWAGWVLLTIAVAYVAISAMHSGSIRLWKWQVPVPPFRLTVCQVLIASADLLVAGAVVYSLFPSIPGMGYMTVLGIFILAFVVSVLSHVPGGYAVIEGIILLAVKQHGQQYVVSVTASIIMFRLIYYWIPLVIAAAMLVGHELTVRDVPESTEGEESRRETPAITD